MTDVENKDLLFNNKRVRYGDVLAANGIRFSFVIQELFIPDTHFNVTELSHKSVHNHSKADKFILFFHQKSALEL